MNKYELSDLYGWRSTDAKSKGLTQKSEEYKEISTALFDRAFAEERGITAFDLNRILGWKPYYNKVSYAVPPLCRNEKESFLHAAWYCITDEWNWKKNCSPGFPEVFERIYENIKIFLLWNLSPWFHTRYRFSCAFSNLNDSKLLDHGINWTYVRNRQKDTAYYLLKFCGFHYTLTKTQLIKDGEEGGQNGFILGIMLGLGGMNDEEFEAEKAKIHEVKTKLCSGWVFGFKSFTKELNKIIQKTQDLEWSKD